MARRQTRITDWPFPADQEVTLTWVRSPRRVATGGKQWRTTATFTPSGDGATPQTVELPWGMLPLLRPGTSYLDGYLHKRFLQGGEHDISVQKTGALAPARECLGSVAWADLSGEDGDELLFVLETLQGRYFLPVSEAIRVLLAPNKTLVLGLLEADYLARVVADSRVVVRVKPNGEERILHLDFISEITSSALDRSVVRHVGRLLYDDSFRRAWDAVERERHRRTGAAGPTGELAHVPLLFPLPKLQDRWRVRADLVGENTYLIAEILSVTAALELPFSDVIYTSPNFTRAVRKPAALGTRGRAAEGNVDSGEQRVLRPPRTTLLSTASLSPQDSRKTKRAGTVSYGLRGDEHISVGRLAKRERVIKIPAPSAKDPGGSISTRASLSSEANGIKTVGGRTQRITASSDLDRPPIEEISLGAAAPNGERAPGEYQVVASDATSESKLHPLPLKCQPHEGFDAFAAALKVLTSLNPALQIAWYIDQLVGRGSYARMGSQPRRYVLVRCAGGLEPPCWLLEFAQLDRCAPSTLILFPLGCTNFDALRRFVADEILSRALQPRGWWDWLELMKMHAEQQLRFAFLRHESLEPEHWAGQLQRRIKDARRAVWLPTGSIW